MKRKIATLLLVLIMCMSVFTGCSLVTRNDKNYYEALVATISYTDGETEEITKRELLTAYNSYGYNYVNNYGYTQKQAIQITLDSVIENKLTIKAVKNYYKENADEGEVLNGRETTYLWDETYEAVYSNLKSYVKEVLDMDDDDSSDDSSSSSNSSVYSAYTKTAYIDTDANGKLVIKKTTPATTTRETYTARTNVDGIYVNFEYEDADGNYIFKDSMYSSLMSDVTEGGRNWRSGLNKYLSAIKKSYDYMTFKTEKEWIVFELERVYSIMKDNYMVEKYEVIYNEQAKQDADTSNVTISDILKYYSAQVRADYASYVLEGDTSTYASNILDSDVNYVLEGNDATNYFYVAQIKIEMSSDDQSKLETLDANLANQSITQAKYDEEVNKIYARLSAKIRDAETGEETGKTISADNLLKEINDTMSDIKYLTVDQLTDEQKADANADGLTEETYVERYNKSVEKQRATAFRKYLYLYNDDDTLKGADHNTVFGVTSSKEVLASDTFSDNEDIEDAILALYNDGNAVIGDATDFIRTDDGVYMFFYAGKIENLFKGIDEKFDASKQISNIYTLTTAKLNIFSNKTIFDEIYDTLVSDNFSVFQNMNMNALKQTLTTSIEKIENNIKDLY